MYVSPSPTTILRLQVRQKRGTWRLPSDDTPVEGKRLTSKDRSPMPFAPTPSSQGGGGAHGDAGAFAKAPSRWAGRTSVRRPPPIQIPPPPSRLPVPSFEDQWSAGEAASGMDVMTALAGAGITVDKYGTSSAAQRVEIFHGANLEGLSVDGHFRQRHESFVSKRSSRRSFTSARSQASDEESGNVGDTAGQGERDVPYKDADEDSSDADDLQFFDAIDFDEQDQYGGIGGMSYRVKYGLRAGVLLPQRITFVSYGFIHYLDFFSFTVFSGGLSVSYSTLLPMQANGQKVAQLFLSFVWSVLFCFESFFSPSCRLSHLPVPTTLSYPIEQEHLYPSPGVPPMSAWGEPSTLGRDCVGPTTASSMKPEFLTQIPRAWAIDDDEDGQATEEKLEVVEKYC